MKILMIYWNYKDQKFLEQNRNCFFKNSIKDYIYIIEVKKSYKE